VAGFLSFLCLFPCWSGFILRVFLPPARLTVLTFRELTLEILSYVAGIRLSPLYEEQAALGREVKPNSETGDGREGSPTVKRVLTVPDILVQRSSL